jgi:hypothetical protein
LLKRVYIKREIMIMFNGVELALGMIGSLIGIGGGYLVLTTVFAGLRFLSRRGSRMSQAK